MKPFLESRSALGLAIQNREIKYKNLGIFDDFTYFDKKAMGFDNW